MIVAWHSLDLDQAIKDRHSTRMFLPQPVPRELVDEALALARPERPGIASSRPCLTRQSAGRLISHLCPSRSSTTVAS
jgi:hypothetical protein